MNPRKIKWYLGNSSFAMIMEQERKHWLLKTDKTKQVQDTITGDTFKGRIDNLGSDIIIETEKLYIQDAIVHNGTFSSENVSNVFDIASSVFPYVPEMNGLHFLRLKSINMMVDDQYHNFRLKLPNVETCYIPMAPDASDPDTFLYKWYCTMSTPILQMMDGNGQWTIEQPITFGDGVTHPVFYYPANEILEPISSSVSSSTLTTELITDQEMIGYPFLWFTCDESDIGPKVSMLNKTDPSNPSYLTLGHPGNSYQYKCSIYPAAGIESDIVPADNIDDWKLVCLSSKNGAFSGDITDYSKPISTVVMRRVDDTTDDQQTIQFINDRGNNVVTMNQNAEWEYDQSTNSYSVQLGLFATNLYGTSDVLIPAFDVKLDETIPFEDTTTDTGFSGVRFSSSNTQDQQPRYPHDLVNLDGLPEWIRNAPDDIAPQHAIMYAVHNTPFYNPSDQSTRQIAGLILDPGVKRDYDTNFHPGKYKINNISVVYGGSGYNHVMDERVVVHGYYYNGAFYEEDTHTTEITGVNGKMYIDEPTDDIYVYDSTSGLYGKMPETLSQIYGKNRFWITYRDGSRSRTLVEVTSVDENGAVTGLNPLYSEDADDHVSEMIYGYYDQEKGKFFTDYTETTEITPDNSKLYYAENLTQVYKYDTDYSQYTSIENYNAGSAYEETYEPNALSGANLLTTWTYGLYSLEDLMAARTAQLNGTGDGIMPDGYPWWYHTHTTGTGLIVAIDEEAVEEIEPPFTSDDVPTEQIGRVYVLSNDSPVYQNNRTAKNPKPDRTAARMCDIPTSVMQLSNIHGVAPTSVVDKKYIRSEATFTANDQNYLFNGSKSRWVKPTALNESGIPIYNPESSESTQSNAFIFDSMDLLNQVDLIQHNDFRETINLNQSVDPSNVSIASIVDGGSGYHVDSTGTIVVGGYSFTYQVISVSPTGSVTFAMIASNDDADARINLANFDMASESVVSGLTIPYGTSPNAESGNTYGTGLKVVLRIADYDQLIPRKGEIFSDLFAFVSDFDGIWLVTRDGDRWKKNTQLAMSYNSETRSGVGNPSLRDSYLNSILPSARELPISLMKAYAPDVNTLKAFVTASSINVVDTNCTPVHVPQSEYSSETDEYDNRLWVDINKMYCRGFKSLTASAHSEAAVMDAIKKDNGMRFDSYIFWRWQNPSDMSNFTFVYGVIHRSLDNLQTTDTTTVLPENELDINKYVHTNAQTTIMWNVPHVGPMVWMFDPNSTIHEKYYVNANTRELYVTREEYSWSDIEISDSAGVQRLNLVEDSGSGAHIAYNIYTNSPAYSNAETNNVIYQQPGYTKIINMNAGDTSDTKPKGSWRLVFPSINTTGTFKLKSSSPDDGREFTPVRMTVLRGSNISNTTDVLNEDGDPVNYKTLLVDENTMTKRLDLRLYDQENHEWSNI